MKLKIALYIGLFFFSFGSFADTWEQDNWNAGQGQQWWTNPSAYYAGEKIKDSDSGEISLAKYQWQYLSSLSGATRVYALVDSTANVLYATADSSKVLFKSIDAGSTWVLCYSDYGWPYTFSCKLISNSIYVGFKHIGGNGYIAKTQNDGQNWTYSGIPQQAIYSINYMSDTVIIFGTGKSAAIYRGSIENGWVKQDISEDSVVLALAKTYDNKLCAGTGDVKGSIFLSVDSGKTWNETADLPDASSIYSIIQTKDSVIYAGTGPSGIVYKSINGTVWDTTASIPGALEIRALVCDSLGGVYAGVSSSDDSGYVFYSADKGNSWVQIGTNAVCKGKILSLLHTPDGKLLAGTDTSARIYKAPRYDTLGSIVSSIYNTGTANGSVEYDTISWDADYNGQEIVVKVRTFRDTVAWSDTIPWNSCPPCTVGKDLSSLSSVQDGMQFVQYKINLVTKNPFAAPVFRGIRMNYSLDTLAPVITGAVASGDEIFFPPDSFVPNDKVVISFNESVDTVINITTSNIDSIFKLSYNHKWEIVSSVWDTSFKNLTVTLSESSGVMVGDTVYPCVYLTDSLSDKWGNKCVSKCIITGTFAPTIDSIIASDGQDSVDYVDDDDYVTLYFSKRTDKPVIDETNIDDVLKIYNHTWLDGKSELDSCRWDSLGFNLTCFLKADSLRPTINVGDTVFPDSITIMDQAGKGAVISPCIIGGTFGEYGPVMITAKAFEGSPQETGIGDGDWVEIYFNKRIQGIQWETVDLDSVLMLQNNGARHTWYPYPDSLECNVQTIDTVNVQGFPYTLLFISFTKIVGIEEGNGYKIVKAGLSAYPNPFSKQTTISFTVPGLVAAEQKQNTPVKFNLTPPISIGDTIYPDSNLIKDLQDKGCIKPIALTGSLTKETKGQYLPFVKNEDNPRKLTGNETGTVVTLKIYNPGGQLVKTVVEDAKQPGVYTFIWDGRDDYSHPVKTGTYICKLKINKQILTQKIIQLSY